MEPCSLFCGQKFREVEGTASKRERRMGLERSSRRVLCTVIFRKLTAFFECENDECLEDELRDREGECG